MCHRVGLTTAPLIWARVPQVPVLITGDNTLGVIVHTTTPFVYLTAASDTLIRPSTNLVVVNYLTVIAGGNADNHLRLGQIAYYLTKESHIETQLIKLNVSRTPGK